MKPERSWQVITDYSPFLVALLLMGLTILVYYPGYMSPDSVDMLAMARSAVTSNKYSPMMSYVWRVTDWLLPGPAGMLILQNLVYWSSLAWIAYSAGASRLLGVLFVCTGLWIPTFAMLGTIWKDVGMQGFLLMAVSMALYGRRRRRIWPFALALLSLYLACAYRQNGMVAAAPLIVAVLYYASGLIRPPSWWQAHQLGHAFYPALWVGIVCVLLGGLWLVNSYHVTDERLWNKAMVHDLSAISVAENANYLPAYIDPGNVITVEDLRHMYSPLHADSLFIPGSRRFLEIADPSPDKALNYSLTDTEARDLQIHWLSTVWHHFGSYMHHRLLITSRLLVLLPRQPWYPYITGIESNPWGLMFRRSPLNARITSLTKLAAFSTPLYSAWVYYLIVTLCLLMSFFWPFEHALLVQCLGVSVWLYFLSIFVFGMSGDFRYNIWALSCAPLCIFLLLCGRRKCMYSTATE